jgi:proteasome accessory factor A
VPFLVSRQLICGAGKVLHTARGAEFSVSQRAEHIWESVSSATTRSRPIINTRDEPHADPERYRRLHVIVGDSNMSETTTLLKVGTAELVLRLIEAGVPMRDFTLENPIRAIRDMSRDRTGQTRVALSNGRRISALELQTEYYEKVSEFVRRDGSANVMTERVLDLWERTLRAVAEDKLALIESEIDWAIKLRLLDRYATKHRLSFADPRVAQLDLAYHDIRRSRGLFSLLESRGLANRVTSDPAIFRAKSVPPQTTRAKLRGDFIRAAQEGRHDYTVDWVHLKLNDQAQRTVLCKDPFLAVDERVDRLIASMRRV